MALVATTAAEAAALMLDGDCGMLPVVDGDRLAGVVTDRDLFIALATRNVRASELTVGEVAQRTVWTCKRDDDVREVLAMMQRHRVRRVPVEGFASTVVGVVSMNDIVLATGAEKGVRQAEAIHTLQAICAHHRPAPHISAA